MPVGSNIKYLNQKKVPELAEIKTWHWLKAEEIGTNLCKTRQLYR